jgi:cytochrome P450
LFLIEFAGNKWKKNRRLLTPAFHFQILDNFFDVFNKNADILCEQLIKANNSIKGDSVEDIDVFPYLKRCALDIICGKFMTK